MAAESTTPRVQKKNTVCLYWTRGLCKLGDLDCEFMHRLDENKIALCQFGSKCQNDECPYRHFDLDIRPECIKYRRGFCCKGPMCPDRHIKRDFDKFYEYALTLAEDINPHLKTETKTVRKTALCKTFMNTGRCSKGDTCCYAHGKQELNRRKNLETYKKDTRHNTFKNV